MSIRSLLLVPIVVAAVAAAPAPKDAFNSGVWKGEANYDEEGKFRDCTMTAQSGNEVLLGFVISKDFDWGLVIADETREMPVGMTKAVLILIDSRAPIAAVAKVVDAHGILIPLDNSDAAIEAMRHGKVLKVVTDGAEFSFKMTGTNEAIAALAACVTTHQGTERVEL
ncbi:MAG: hypothetical protein ACREDO_06585 [Methyloceanibacter sp.]